MNAMLFTPEQETKLVTVEGFTTISVVGTNTLESVADLLGCLPALVDIQATGNDFIAFSIFDFEGGYPNETGMRELSILTGFEFGQDDDTTLLGPLLIIKQSKLALE